MFEKLALKAIRRQIRMSEEGASAVEYALLVALIAAIIVVTVGLLGARVSAIFAEVTDAITPG